MSGFAGCADHLVEDTPALMVMQAGLGLSRDDTIAYARMMIDVIVQLEKSGGRRRIAAITRLREDG